MPDRPVLSDRLTPEMVEQGAIGLWQDYKRERVSGTGRMTPLAVAEGRRASGWDEVAIKSWYRRKARAVLESALASDEERQP